MRNSITVFVSLFYLSVLFSQAIVAQVVDRSLFETSLTGSRNYEGKFKPSYIYIKNPKKKITGSFHLFKSWKNIGEIKTINNKSYGIKNINFNIRDNSFESSVGNDSVFVFDLENINFVNINSRKFKSFYFTEIKSNKIFEIILESNSFLLLKEYNCGIKINEPDPLMFRKNTDQYIIKTSYYLKDRNELRKFSLNKKNVLKLFSDKSTQVAKFAENNNFSFKRDSSLKKIFNYYNSL